MLDSSKYYRKTDRRRSDWGQGAWGLVVMEERVVRVAGQKRRKFRPPPPRPEERTLFRAAIGPAPAGDAPA